jgi:TonB family protein
MAFRALLFSKGPETNSALSVVCQTAGIRLEVCTDIFGAIEKATKQNFSCIFVDWSDQPEAGFLLKRARESVNANTVAIAIVDLEPAAAEMQEHRLNFLIYRPVSPNEVQEVLAKAGETMQSVSGGSPGPITDAPSGVDAASTGSSDQNSERATQEAPEDATGFAETMSESEEENGEEFSVPGHAFPLRKACAAVLALAALYCLWHARDTIVYLAQTREKKSVMFKDAVAALFYFNPAAATPAASAGMESQPDPYFSRTTPAPSSSTQPQLAVVSTEAEVSDSRIRQSRTSDFALPAPVYVHEDPPPVEATARRATIPDSLRGTAPITPPVVVTVSPAQMMPVSSPAVPPVSSQQFSEPVAVSEEAARALLLHSVNPDYPAEAIPQKLRGPVVLQAIIGRDGSVEDLKIVRGSFILCKAAIAAVKQWRFQPYTLNGHATQTQTMITINFSYPPG